LAGSDLSIDRSEPAVFVFKGIRVLAAGFVCLGVRLRRDPPRAAPDKPPIGPTLIRSRSVPIELAFQLVFPAPDSGHLEPNADTFTGSVYGFPDRQ
jgi:hypothetical protein